MEDFILTEIQNFEKRGALWTPSQSGLLSQGSEPWEEKRLSPHDEIPEPPSGRSLGRPDNPNATELKKLPKPVQEKMMNQVLNNSGMVSERPLTIGEIQKHLRSEFDHVVKYDPDSMQYGMLWYPDVHQLTEQMSDKYPEVSPHQFGCNIAAMSPNNSWPENKAMALYMARLLNEDKPIQLPPDLVKKVSQETLMGYSSREKKKIPMPERQINIQNGSTLSEMFERNPLEAAWALKSYGQAIDDLRTDEIAKSTGNLAKVRFNCGTKHMAKAIAIFYGLDPDTILTGHKVRSFANCINITDNPIDVTVDSHAISAAVQRRLVNTSPIITKLLYGGLYKHTNNAGPYPVWAEAYRREAKKVGLLPHEFQAILWESWRKKTKNMPVWEGFNGEFPVRKRGKDIDE